MDNIVQGSPEWLAMRAGKVTASRVADVIAKTKTGVSASRAKYAGELIAERLTGQPAERFTNGAMAWGTEKEPDARKAYEFYRDTDVAEVAFVPHPTIADSGASPDGLVDVEGLLEIKCPETHTHIETLLNKAVPSKYVTQMMWQMACTGRKWCDFVSFDPRLPESMQFFCQRVHRDEAVIAELEREVVVFINEVRGKVAELRRLYEPAEADPAASMLMAG
ncbi:lambda exonuclease family protein [Rhizobium sp. Root483D2]|uniref:lambda exonuclease family protein n=1 Tax=Rhizobium sp. Root483D2 TaxID=1736545 RepID=UPI0007127B13|nr:lambda exonuclease family protein [Rhizobium sp. Root483D2]KQY39981.1 exonuclease [Rhizobium sp. Root483D2]